MTSTLAIVDELLEADDADQAAAGCVAILRRLLDRPMIGVYLIDGASGGPRHAATWNVSDAFATSYERAGRAIDPVLSTALRRRATTYNLSLMPLARWRRTEVYRRAAHLDRFAHVVIAPAVSGGRVTATVNVGDDEGGAPFRRAELHEVTRVSQALAVVLREHRRRAAARPAPAPAAGPVDPRLLAAAGLTAREAEVAALVAGDLTDAEIGRALHVSPHTVRQHLKSVYRKLEVRSRVGLTRRWLGADGPPKMPCPSHGSAPEAGLRSAESS
ncbi:helix-turn-helix transcriptional regulator [Patulibacter defluvii]|uniref:helix-turn-helix transcriptional regulator n=1 Tax=Patulibacter defluvii TaxID=3095358 RepID=UPI002A74E7DE|nr:helix-turn-helix transcriptional regulator [Patulibacter sp. DM4]